MPFDWVEYKNLSDFLHQKLPGYEAADRTVISRNYYSAFHLAFQYLRDQKIYDPPSNTKDNTHHEVRERYLTSLNRQDIYSALDTLRTTRNQADYFSTVHNLKGKVLQSFQLWDLVAEEIKKLRGCRP